MNVVDVEEGSMDMEQSKRHCLELDSSKSNVYCIVLKVLVISTVLELFLLNMYSFKVCSCFYEMVGVVRVIQINLD